jgi:SPASM domain peptide maturase of grasp-with-spasm system
MRFYIHSNCYITNGINRSLIIDTERDDFEFLPLEFAIKLIQYNSMYIKEFVCSFEEKDADTVKEYIIHLIKKEYLFITNLITPIDYQEKPSFISSKKNYTSIIDIEETLESLEEFISKMENEKLNINIIQLRFFKVTSINKLILALKLFENTIVKNIQILGDFSDDINSISNLKNKFPRLQFINNFNSKDANEDELFNCDGCKIINSTRKINSEKDCGVISSKFFNKNSQNYSLSINHNSCLYKKISMDRYGNLKNCPSMIKSFGNIKTTSLNKVIADKSFQKLGKIKKENIDSCKDCEFRNICTDCRAYIENPRNDHSKPLKCGYNPYTNVWEEWSINPLKQMAIEYYGMQHLVNKDAK